MRLENRRKLIKDHTNLPNCNIDNFRKTTRLSSLSGMSSPTLYFYPLFYITKFTQHPSCYTKVYCSEK